MFYSLNALYILALFFGYQVGIRREIRLKWIEWTDAKTYKLIQWVSVLTIVNFVVYLVYIFRSYGLNSFNFVELWEQMLVGLKQPGMGYYLNLVRQEELDGSQVLGGTTYTLLNLFWAFFKNAVAILSILYFKRLKLYGKIFAVAYFVLVVVFYMSIGTNIQIFHLYIILELPAILSIFTAWYEKKVDRRRIIKFVACLLGGLILVAAYFGWMMESRSDTYGYEIENHVVGGLQPNAEAEAEESVPSEPAENAVAEPETVESVPPESSAEESAALESGTEESATPGPDTEESAAPESGVEENASEQSEQKGSPILQKLNNFWISFSSYLTQGYYGMSQALTLDWVPMYGAGNSMFLVNIISNNIYDIDQFTYQTRLEPYGWDSDVNWHSMYTWIANDVSFYGVIPVMFLIGLLFGMMFKDAIVHGNPFAKASIFFFILMMVFIPCNNQVAQSNENLCAFLLLIVLWFLCGKTKVQKTGNSLNDGESV